MYSRRVLALTVTLVSCLGTASFGERQATPRVTARELLGVWDLVSYEDHEPNGRISYGWGQHPSGVLTYSPGGRMSVQFMRDPRATFTAGRAWSRDNRELLPTAPAATSW